MIPPLLIIAQIIGLIAMGLDITATLQKIDKKLIFFQTLGCYTFSLHFLLLGAPSACIAELINGTRNVVSFRVESKKWAYLFIAIYSLMAFVIANNFIDIAPFLSSIAFTAGLYFFTGIRMRLFYCIGLIVSLLYTLYVGSIGGALANAVLLTTNSITIIRLLRTKIA